MHEYHRRAVMTAKRFSLLLPLMTVLLFWGGKSAFAATVPSGFTDAVFVSGLTSPTAMAFAPDGRLFICEQGGNLRVVKNGVLLPTPFTTLSVNSLGERGLLGVAFDPNFASNQYVYVYYTTSAAPIHNRISRFTASGDVASGAEQVIFDLDPLSSANNHNGGAIHFGADGKLYAAVGDNANSANAQSMTTLHGKMLRINADGSIPSDNPFFNQTSNNNRSIWALGLRNPFTFSFQPGANRMFINDVGENTWEEINDGIAGSNYGWSICEGVCNPPRPEYRDPIYSYTNDSPNCAITGGAFYNPPTTQFPVSYVGDYFFADFCGGWIRKLDPASGNTVTDFASGISLPVDLKVSTDGSLYYLARGSRSVGRIQYASGTTAAPVVVSGRVFSASGRGIRNVTITMTEADGNERTTRTSTFGYYRFEDVAAGVTVTLTAKARRFRFDQSTIVRTTDESVTNADFISVD
jgi:glucose/arabinose dehydrogenase